MIRRALPRDRATSPSEPMRQRLTYWQYRSVWAAAARLPATMADRLPEQLGRAWYLGASSRQRQQVRRNLDRVVPDLSGPERTTLIRAAYISYARYWLDSFRLHTMTGEQVVAAVRCEGLHHAENLIADGTGGIFATGHLGSWDVGAFFTVQRGWTMTTVAEVVEPRRLFDRFVELREGAGIEVIPLRRGGDMVDRLESRMREAGSMATLLADRDLSRTGPIVEFFGEPCRLPPGAAVLARRTTRPVVVGGFLTAADGYLGVVQPPLRIDHLSVYDGVQRIARELEVLIRRAPEQWHVFVPNWLSEREPRHPVTREWERGGDWRALAKQLYERRRPRSVGPAAAASCADDVTSRPNVGPDV